jgi:hypothetical protein
MLRSTPALVRLDAADADAVIHRRTYLEALDVFLALWEEARALNPGLGSDWRLDVEDDIAMARTLNARP